MAVKQATRYSWALRYFLLTALIPGHLLDWSVEWLYAVATTMAGVAFFHRVQRQWPDAARTGLVLMLAMSLISLVSYNLTVWGSRFETGPRDFVDLLKPTMVFFSCMLAFSAGMPTLTDIRRGCLIVLTFAVTCGLILMFEIPVLSAVVDAVYGSTKTGFSEFRARLSIPFENPNFLGLFAVLSLFIALNFSDHIDIRLAVVAVVAAGLSGSRTAWVTATLVLLLFLASALRQSLAKGRLPSAPVTALLVLIGLTVFQVAENVESYQRLSDFIDIAINLDLSSDESYAERIALRDNAEALIQERPFIGWGAMKYSPLDIVDSQYYGLLLRFGLLGTVLVLFAAVALIIKNQSSLRGIKDRTSAFLLCLILAAWLWNGSFLENIRLVTLIVMILASTSTAHAKSHR